MAVRSTLAIREGPSLWAVGFGFHCVGTRRVKDGCKAIWVVMRFTETDESFEEHR